MSSEFYAHKPYPKVLYFAGGQTCVVANAAEHGALPPGWCESPGEAEAFAAAAPSGTSDQPPAPPVATQAEQDLAAADAAAAAEAEQVYKVPMGTILDSLQTASMETLERVKGYELANPKGPRKGLIEGIDKLLAAK